MQCIHVFSSCSWSSEICNLFEEWEFVRCFKAFMRLFSNKSMVVVLQAAIRTHG
eukprot:c37878_g1_i1 orf=210-371(+)